jgi:hypothetical protein
VVTPFCPADSVLQVEFPQALGGSGDNAIAAGAHEGERVLPAGANACEELVAHHGASAVEGDTLKVSSIQLL